MQANTTETAQAEQTSAETLVEMTLANAEAILAAESMNTDSPDPRVRKVFTNKLGEQMQENAEGTYVPRENVHYTLDSAKGRKEVQTATSHRNPLTENYGDDFTTALVNGRGTDTPMPQPQPKDHRISNGTARYNKHMYGFTKR